MIQSRFDMTKESYKKCRGCGEERPLNGFYKHPKMSDGHLNKCKPCVRERVNNHRRDNIERYRAYDRRRGFRVYDPDKVVARRKVRDALKSGVLTKHPCVVCGDNKSEAHHHDYNKPIDVIWLCKTHHAKLHRKD